MLLLPVTVIAFAVAIGATHSGGETLSEAPKIAVKQFGRNNVIGHLGHPLGTVVRVTGICVDGETTRRRADLGKTLLEIRTVNGVSLDRPFTFEFRRAAKNVIQPSPGDDFDYYVHEWGTFDGMVSAPAEFSIERPTVANDGFHYRPQVTVHKSNVAVNRSTPEERSKANQ